LTREVFIAGVGMTRFGRHPDSSHIDLAQTAVHAALAECGGRAEDIQAAFYATVVQGATANQHVVPGQFALRPLGVQGIPVFNVENACASSSSALNLACTYVRHGIAEIALAVGVEKLYSDDREARFAIFNQPLDMREARLFLERYAAQLAEAPPGTPAGGPESVLMDCYAGWARLHMKLFGTTPRQFAVVAAKNHLHSVHNPLAQYRTAMSVDEVLAARPVAWPLTVPMCAPISDGAAAAIVCSREALARLGDARPVRVLASVLRTGSDRDAQDFARHLTRLAAIDAYELAGIGADDVSVAEVHDASVAGEIIETEALGFCPLGQGGPLADSGATSIGGRIPVNPSGGLISKGHPLGATGLGQIHEIVTQLRGAAGARQVAGARIGLAQNSGGIMGVEEAVTSVVILESCPHFGG
jgi:acetyl-CoA acetyltransferase